MAKVMRGLSLLRSSSRIVRESTTYTLDPAMSEAEALAYWMGHDKETFVAEQDGVVLGTYYMRPIRPAADDTSATAVT